MLFGKHAVHELDQNAIYNRKIDVDLHHLRLKQIKNRKNLYEADLALNELYFKNFKKFKSQSGFGIIRDKIIKRDNKYFLERINKIRQRKPDNSEGLKLISFINTRNKFFYSYRMLQQKKINEENKLFNDRLINQIPDIDRKKIAEEFEEHKKLYFKLRRIKPSPNTKNFTSFYEDNKKSNLNKSTLDVTKYSLKKDYNFGLLKKNNSMPSIPDV